MSRSKLKRVSTFKEVQEHLAKFKGITYNPLTGRSPCYRSGFFVSLKDGKVIRLVELSSEVLSDFIVDNLSCFAKQGHFLGIWIDGEKVYIDVSIWVRGYSRAISLAKDNDQIAIWDIKNKRVLNV